MIKKLSLVMAPIFFGVTAFFCVHLVQAQVSTSSPSVYGVGNNGTVVHFDGDAWTTVESGTENTLFSIFGKSNTDFYATGENGTVLRFRSMSLVSPMTLPSDFAKNQRYSSGQLYSKGNEYDVFAAGGGGSILRARGSAGFADMASYDANLGRLVTFGAVDVWAYNERDIWVVAGDGRVLHYDGSEWLPFLQMPESFKIGRAISATEKYLYIAGASKYNTDSWGTLLRYSRTNGELKAIVNNTSLPIFESMWIFSDDNIYLGAGNPTSEHRFLVHWDGDWFDKIGDYSKNQITGLWGDSDGTLYLTGYNPQDTSARLARYKNGRFTYWSVPNHNHIIALWGVPSPLPTINQPQTGFIARFLGGIRTAVIGTIYTLARPFTGSQSTNDIQEISPNIETINDHSADEKSEPSLRTETLNGHPPSNPVISAKTETISGHTSDTPVSGKVVLPLTVQPISDDSMQVVKTVIVDARNNARATPLDTGIVLRDGDSFWITAGPNSSWSLGSGPNYTCSSDGCPALGISTLGMHINTAFSYGTLVGLANGVVVNGNNNDIYFGIGSDFHGVADKVYGDGKLYLLNWDDVPEDNSGRIKATITVNRASSTKVKNTSAVKSVIPSSVHPDSGSGQQILKSNEHSDSTSGIEGQSSSGMTKSEGVFTVSARDHYPGGHELNTGIVVRQDQTLEITVSGNQSWSIGSDTCTADGCPKWGSQPMGPNPDQLLPFGALTGYVSGLQYSFSVGSNFKKVMEEDGILRLFIWDSMPQDDSGSITANVKVY